MVLNMIFLILKGWAKIGMKFAFSYKITWKIETLGQYNKRVKDLLNHTYIMKIENQKENWMNN